MKKTLKKLLKFGQVMIVTAYMFPAFASSGGEVKLVVNYLVYNMTNQVMLAKIAKSESGLLQAQGKFVTPSGAFADENYTYSRYSQFRKSNLRVRWIKVYFKKNKNDYCLAKISYKTGTSGTDMTGGRGSVCISNVKIEVIRGTFGNFNCEANYSLAPAGAQFKHFLNTGIIIK